MQIYFLSIMVFQLIKINIVAVSSHITKTVGTDFYEILHWKYLHEFVYVCLSLHLQETISNIHFYKQTARRLNKL
jgi:hypothetical protein